MLLKAHLGVLLQAPKDNIFLRYSPCPLCLVVVATMVFHMKLLFQMVPIMFSALDDSQMMFQSTLVNQSMTMNDVYQKDAFSREVHAICSLNTHIPSPYICDLDKHESKLHGDTW